MRKASKELSQSRGLKRRPLLRTSSPLKPKINRELTLELVQRTGALHLPHAVIVGFRFLFQADHAGVGSWVHILVDSASYEEVANCHLPTQIVPG